MRIFFLLIITLLFQTSLKAQIDSTSKQDKLNYFLKIVDTLRNKGENPAMAIAIVYENELIFKGGFGVSNIENKTKVNNQTLFEIGSLTKGFTGTIASLLIKDGLIKWDDKVKKHIPNFKLKDKYAEENTTLIDLLTHKVGLDKHYYLMYGPKYESEELLSKIEYLSFSNTFREKYVYNNFMYTIAGMLEENVSNKNWDTLIKEKIFLPLKMNHSFSTSDDFLKYENRTTSYRNDGKTVIPHYSFDTYAPAGNITSNIDDMSKWLMMFANYGQVDGTEFLAKKEIDFLVSPLTVKNGLTKEFYGIGWEIDLLENTIYHKGSSAGQQSIIQINPEQGFGIVVLTNQQSAIQSVIGYYADRIFLKNNFERLTQYEEIIEKRANQTISNYDDFSLNDENEINKAEKIIGTYNHPAYGKIIINKKHKNVFSFEYTDFIGTIKSDKKNDTYIAFVNHFTGKEEMHFKINYRNNKVKSITLNIAYTEPLEFEKN